MARAQVTNAKNKNPFPVKYTSVVDQKIILKTITLAPVYDNVNGIYSIPIQKLLVDLLQNDKVWGYAEFPDFNKKVFVETFDTNPNEVLNVLAKNGSQGLLTALITKGPRGLNARLKLFTQDQGLILLEESFQDLETFELAKVRTEFVRLYHNLKNKLPYRGFVLSRRGLEVTLNLGAQNGVTLGQELSVSQILKLNRHPKLKTLVGIEREVIGRLKVTKVESDLSFAQIIFEKETGVVEVGAKILPTEYVSYPYPKINGAGEVLGDEKVTPKPESEKKTETKSENAAPQTETAKKPNLNKVIVQGGLSQYAESTSFTAGTTSDAAQGMAATLLLGGQFWLYENFFIEASMKQSFFGATNTLNGSTPAGLNYTVSRYLGAFGYNYFFTDSPWGPQLAGSIGFISYRTKVNDSSPTASTNTQTDGTNLKLTALIPLQPEKPFEIGADLNFMLSSNFTETPVTSGTPTVQVGSYGVFLKYISTPNFRYRIDVTLENIDASFTGAGTRSNSAKAISIKNFSELFGVEYLF